MKRKVQLQIVNTEMLNISISKEDLSNGTASTNWERAQESEKSHEDWRKLLPQLVLGVVFITINCVIVSAMWRKRG